MKSIEPGTDLGMAKTSDSFLTFPQAAALTRRSVISSSVTALAACLLPLRKAEAQENPPKLDGKVQFKLLNPTRPMPALTLRRLNDKPVELVPTRGRAMLVNFWATWSSACETELPMLDDLQQAFGKQLDIAAIAHDGGGRMVVEPFLRKKNIKHLSIYLDPDGVATGIASDKREAGPFVLYDTPMSYLIAPNGQIAGYIPGPVNWSSDPAHALLHYFMQAG
jgi:thiol-disulfide isomerase/thioredoxin